MPLWCPTCQRRVVDAARPSEAEPLCARCAAAFALLAAELTDFNTRHGIT